MTPDYEGGGVQPTTSSQRVFFPPSTLAFVDSLGVRIQCVLSDNGNGYALRFDLARLELDPPHPNSAYHPSANGRVERLNGTIHASAATRSISGQKKSAILRSR